MSKRTFADMVSDSELSYVDTSNDEEYNNLDDLFEVNDSDVAMPDDDEEDEEEPNRKFNVTLYDVEAMLTTRVSDMLRSECMKRRTLSLMICRFGFRSKLPRRFLTWIHEYKTPGVNKRLDESVTAWLRRVRNEYPWKYIIYCVLFHLLFVSKSGKRYIQQQEQHTQVASVSSLLSDLQVVECSHGSPYFTLMRRFCLVNTQRFNSLFQSCSNIQYRLGLCDVLRTETVELKRGVCLMLRKLHMNPESSEIYNLVLRYVYPNYHQHPVRGPFRAGFKGRSCSQMMYGAEPNYNFYYCLCRESGAVCGHPVFLSLLRIKQSRVNRRT